MGFLATVTLLHISHVHRISKLGWFRWLPSLLEAVLLLTVVVNRCVAGALSSTQPAWARRGQHDAGVTMAWGEVTNERSGRRRLADTRKTEQRGDSESRKGMGFLMMSRLDLEQSVKMRQQQQCSQFDLLLNAFVFFCLRVYGIVFTVFAFGLVTQECYDFCQKWQKKKKWMPFTSLAYYQLYSTAANGSVKTWNCVWWGYLTFFIYSVFRLYQFHFFQQKSHQNIVLCIKS